MKIYNYKNGEKAVFVNNEKIIISDFIAEIINKFYTKINSILNSYVDDPESVINFIKDGHIVKRTSGEVNLWLIDNKYFCIENGDQFVYAENTYNFDEWVKMYFCNDNEEKNDNSQYIISEDGLVKFDTTSDNWPSEPEKCAYLAETGEKLDLDWDSSYDCLFSYYQGKNGALVIEHDSDGTENPEKSGWYLTSSFEEFEEMYL